MTKLNILDKIIINPVATTYIPIIVILIVIYKHYEGARIRLFLIEINLIIVFYYWLLQDFGILNPENSVIIKCYLPRVSYILCLLSLLTRDSLQLLFALTPSLILISGYSSPIIYVTLFIQVYSFWSSFGHKDPALLSLFLSLTASQYFYVTGHRCNFPSLQIASAFTGFEIFNLYISGLLLTLNTLGSFLVIFSAFNFKKSHIFYTVAHILVYFTVTLFLTTLNTAVNRRHLMVWPIFAPKYIFELMTTCFVYITCLVGLVFFWRPLIIKKME